MKNARISLDQNKTFRIEKRKPKTVQQSFDLSNKIAANSAQLSPKDSKRSKSDDRSKSIDKIEKAI
jgi:hypothetical protein